MTLYYNGKIIVGKMSVDEMTVDKMTSCHNDDGIEKNVDTVF
jgi:hypothetical protein